MRVGAASAKAELELTFRPDHSSGPIADDCGALMAKEMPGAGLKTKVFISYARGDLEFADRLLAALEARGLSVLINKKGPATHRKVAN